MSNLWQSIAGLPNFLLYFALALALLAVFVAIYVRVTQYREFVLIRGGNGSLGRHPQCRLLDLLTRRSVAKTSVPTQPAGLEFL